MIKNLKITKKMMYLGLSSTMSLTLLTGCGNKQFMDFNKSFNVVIEKNSETLSVAGIQAYSDYDGSQVQFVTNDNLRVLSSTMQTQLVKADSEDSVNNYVTSLAKENDIVFYDKLQGTNISYNSSDWNKDIVDLNFTYNKAIIVSDDNAVILELNTWKDYEDDKIQIRLTDNTCILTNADKVKLINDEEAAEDSIKNYAISLVGDEDKVIFYDAAKTK